MHDKHGGLIGNLNKDDFTVLEDGKPQTIKYFTRETDLPLTIGLLIDVSASQRNLLDIEKRAAHQFFSQVLRKKDEAFLISFGEESELLQDYTNSPETAAGGSLAIADQFRRVGHRAGPCADHQPAARHGALRRRVSGRATKNCVAKWGARSSC